MKIKFKLFLFLIFFIGNSYAQTLITDTLARKYYKKYVVDDATGAKNGSYEMVYYGKTLTKGSYKNGKRNGVWEFTGYNDNLQQKGSYVDDLKDGEWRSYYLAGELSCIMPYKMGKNDGVFKGFYENGNLSFEKPYVNDVVHGTFTEYFPDGKVHKITTYLGDTLNGVSKEYYESGILKVEKYMKGDLKDSIYTSYYGNAALHEKLMYKKGSLYNVISYLGVDGKKFDYGTLKDGTGTIRFFDANGKLISEEILKNSFLDGYAKYYKEGMVSREGNYMTGKREGLWITNYPTGELSAKTNYKNGLLEGDAVDYLKNGGIQGKGKYENGQRSGLWVSYDENGLPYSEINYSDGLMNGEAKYYKKGKLSSEGKYNKGSKIYIWKTYDENGLETTSYDYGYAFVTKEEADKKKDTQTPFPPPPPPPPPPGTKPATNQTEDIFTITEQMPSFPGGNEMMTEFVQKNIVYPQMEKEAGIQGTCYVTFVVDQVGEIRDVRILRGVAGGKGCDIEAKRIVEMMPRWNPGMQSGQPVSVQFNFPIKYHLR